MKFFGNIFLGLVSTAVALVLSECLLRIIYNPIDFLEPTTARHTHLPKIIVAHTGGHDAWGFRNQNVPKQADIVCIGDSFTYGVGTSWLGSYPVQMANITQKNVYNMGISGYGPLDYLYLLNQKALLLKPKTIVLGFYLGNDFYDAYTRAYSNPNYAHWQLPDSLHQPNITLEKVDKINFPSQADHYLFYQQRVWLAQNSVLYRWLGDGVVGGFVNNYRYSKGTLSNQKKWLTLQNDSIGKVEELIFQRAKDHATNLLTDPMYIEGKRLTFAAIDSIRQVCTRHKIELLVVCIPTKEWIYAPRVEKFGQEGEKIIFRKIVAYYSQMQSDYRAYFKQKNIHYLEIDLALRQKIEQTDEPINPPFDTHFNAKGYEVVASEVAKAIEKR